MRDRRSMPPGSTCTRRRLLHAGASGLAGAAALQAARSGALAAPARVPAR